MDENFPKKYLFSQKELAEIFCVSPAAICQWKIDPVEKNSDGAFYYLPEAIAYWKNINGRKSDLSLEEERAKLAREQTYKTRVEKQLKSIELAEKKKTVVAAKDVERVWSSLITAFRAKILSIPSSCASALLSFKNEAEAENFLRDKVTEALEELTRIEDASQEEKSTEAD